MTSQTPSPLAQLPSSTLGLLVGPQLIGIIFAWALQGILSVQVYIYRLYFPKDRLFTKLLVYGVFVYEWVQLGLATQAVFEMEVYHFGDVGSLTSFYNTWFSIPVMSAIISGVVQSYYAYRLWVLSRSKVLVGAIGVLSFAQVVLGIAGGITLHILGVTAVQGDTINRPIVASGLVIGTVVDVLIAVAMSYFLLRSKSGMKQTDDIVNRLVRLVIETGALTATVALVYVVVFMVETKNLLFECPAIVLPKLYSNMLIVSLNNRVFVRGDAKNLQTMSSSNNTISVPGTAGTTLSRTLVRDDAGEPSRHELHINVTEDTYIARDDASTKAAAVELMPIGTGRGWDKV